MTVYVFSDLATTTLNGDITNSSTTIVLTSASKFATGGTGYVNIENELISYTGISGNSLTGCVRGLGSPVATTAAGHLSGAIVTSAVAAVEYTAFAETGGFVDLTTNQTAAGNKTWTGHILSTGTAPSLGSLQTNVTAQSISGDDTRGILSITTGAVGPALGGAVAVVTFAVAYGATPAILLTAGSVSGAAAAGFSHASESASVFTVVADVLLTALTTYTVHYLVLGAT